MMTKHEQIKAQISDSKVVVYMKGTPQFPQCGFSGRVVDILKAHNIEFASYNVLEDPKLREEIKVFSDWPTIPQVYVDGEFIGGCDILVELEESGELTTLLSAA